MPGNFPALNGENIKNVVPEAFQLILKCMNVNSKLVAYTEKKC
jgi:hypothetical protein